MSSRYRSAGVSPQPSSFSLVEQALKQVLSTCALLFGVRHLGYLLGHSCPPPWYGRLCSSLLVGFAPPWLWPSARQHLVSYFVLFFTFVMNDYLQMCCNNCSLP